MDFWNLLNEAVEEEFGNLDTMSDEELMEEFEKLESYFNLCDEDAIEISDFTENLQTKAFIEIILHTRGYYSKTIFLKKI